MDTKKVMLQFNPIHPTDIRTSNPEDIRFNLNCNKPEDIFKQLPGFSVKGYNLFPNFPMVYLKVKPWIYQKNRLWIVTKDIPNSVYEFLFDRNLVPLHGYNYTHDNMEHDYYQMYSYNYTHA